MPSFLFVATTEVGNTDSLSLTTSAAVAVDWLQATVGSMCQEPK
jgi:hypothetical protein